jgi:hypothetical protein
MIREYKESMAERVTETGAWDTASRCIPACDKPYKAGKD